MQIISRAEAKKLGLKRYFTNKPCINGHVAERTTSSGGCLECSRLQAASKYIRRSNRPRKEAKISGRHTYFTGDPCKNGHVAERRVVNGACVECAKMWNAITLSRHKEKILAKNRIRHATWRKDKKEHLRSYHRDWAEKHKDLIKEKSHRSYLKNKYRFVVAARKREKKIRQATPKWADIFAIYEIYKESERISRETGIKHHVDHVVPIVNPREYNLRVIPAKENLSKHNKLDEELIESLYKDAA